MALVYEWRIEGIVASDNDPISNWPDNVGTVDLTNAGGSVRPLYKNAITPTGKPVLRFDGVDDILSSAAGLNDITHVFIVAAWRGSGPSGGNHGLFGASDGSVSAIPTLYRDSAVDANFTDGGSNFNLFRDGVDTNAWYTGGQFAIYEGLYSTPSGGDKTIQLGNWAGRPGPWDVCYLGIYDAPVTGSPLTNLRRSLRNRYIQKQSGAGDLIYKMHSKIRKFATALGASGDSIKRGESIRK